MQMKFGQSPLQIVDNLKISGNFICQLLQHFQNFTYYISYYTHSERWLFPQTALSDWRQSLSFVNWAQDFVYDLNETQFCAKSIKVLGGFPRPWSRSVLLSTSDIFAQTQPSKLYQNFLIIQHLKHYAQPKCTALFLCQILRLSSSLHLFFRIPKAVLYLDPNFFRRTTGYCLGTSKP